MKELKKLGRQMRRMSEDAIGESSKIIKHNNSSHYPLGTILIHLPRIGLCQERQQQKQQIGTNE